MPATFVQDNLSRSVRGTLRGLHFQEPNAQGKLVQVTRGAVFDVAVDVRRGSPTFGEWLGVELSGDAPRQLWIPPGFAHGFCVTSETRRLLVQVHDCVRARKRSASIRWDDPRSASPGRSSQPLLVDEGRRGAAARRRARSCRRY